MQNLHQAQKNIQHDSQVKTLQEGNTFKSSRMTIENNTFESHRSLEHNTFASRNTIPNQNTFDSREGLDGPLSARQLSDEEIKVQYISNETSRKINVNTPQKNGEPKKLLKSQLK